MNIISMVLRDDIILDEEAFAQASEDFAQLVLRLEKLNDDIERMLTLLQEGFDTPAGRKFVSVCRSSLEKPINDQGEVLRHVSQTLTEVRKSYSWVFKEYGELNDRLAQYKRDT